MKKTAVIYESKYGSTKRYAQWIAEALSCPLFERREFPVQQLSEYEVVIYGGGLYAGGISGIKLITKNQTLLSNKKVILFTCGLADPENPDNISSIRKSLEKTLSPEMLNHIQIFHLRGGIDYPRLSFIHRSMMAMLRRMLLKKDADSLTQEDRQLLETYGKCVNFTDPEAIRPIINYINSITQ